MSDIPRDPPEDGGEGDDLEKLQETEGQADDDLGLDESGDEEGGPDEAGQEEQEEEVEAKPRPSRARDTIVAQRRRAQDAERERDDLRRRLEVLEHGSQTPRADPDAQRRQAEAETQELERLWQQDPLQAIQQVRNRERQAIGQALQQSEARIMDRQDLRDWQQTVRSDRTAARLNSQVEAIIDGARRQGNYATTRQLAYEVLVGQEVLRQRSQRGPQQTRQAQRRVARQTVRPGSGRGDLAPARRQQVDGDEALLRGATVEDI